MKKYIRDNIEEVRSRIEAAAGRAGRDPGEVTILAATKNRSPQEIEEAVMAGIHVAGENRVQELLTKVSEAGGAVEWHFIGHLQRNKVRQVVGVVELIHSVDGERLAVEIDQRAGQRGIVQAVLLQVNIAEEDSKSGLEPGELQGFLRQVRGLENLSVRGLSTIAPLVDDPEEARWVFRRLAELGRELESADRDFRCEALSMGMTNDYEVAVEEGSTCVRIGTAIFGPRAQEG